MKNFKLPRGHQPGMEVPKGGSCCANCRWWNPKLSVCTSTYYRAWAGGNKIPLPADRYCSDWYEPTEFF